MSCIPSFSCLGDDTSTKKYRICLGIGATLFISYFAISLFRLIQKGQVMKHISFAKLSTEIIQLSVCLISLPLLLLGVHLRSESPKENGNK